MQFIWLMRILAVIYVAVGLVFLFFPHLVLALANVGPTVFSSFEPIPAAAERFWVVLATAMMAMLAAVAFYSSLYPKVKAFILIHLLSKGVSIAGFTYCFLKLNHYFAYFIGAAVDSAILIVVLLSALWNLLSPVRRQEIEPSEPVIVPPPAPVPTPAPASGIPTEPDQSQP